MKGNEVRGEFSANLATWKPDTEMPRTYGGETDMEEKEFQRIEQMMSRMMGQFRGEIGEDFRHQLGLQREDFQHKLDLVVEGQQSLAEGMVRLEGRMDRVENSLERVEVRVLAVEKKLETKMDAVAADVAAHRRDTEAHSKGWRVSDGE